MGGTFPKAEFGLCCCHKRSLVANYFSVSGVFGRWRAVDLMMMTTVLLRSGGSLFFRAQVRRLNTVHPSSFSAMPCDMVRCYICWCSFLEPTDRSFLSGIQSARFSVTLTNEPNRFKRSKK